MKGLINFLILINLIYASWIVYLLQLINTDKVYVVFLFWTLVIIFINLIIAAVLKFIYKLKSTLPMWFCFVEFLGLIIFPFFI